MTGPTPDDFVTYRLDSLDRRFDDLDAAMTRGFERLHEKLDERASHGLATAQAVTKLEARLDSYKRSGQILLGVTVAVGGFIGWISDVGSWLGRVVREAFR